MQIESRLRNIRKKVKSKTEIKVFDCSLFTDTQITTVKNYKEQV